MIWYNKPKHLVNPDKGESKNMKKRKVLLLAGLAVLAVAVLLLLHVPKRMECTMTVSTTTGETAVVAMDLKYYRNLILPSYVKGTIQFEGISYTDQYSKLKEVRNISGNRLYPPEWWKTKQTMPYNMTFLLSDETDVLSIFRNTISVYDLEWDQDIKVHLVLLDERNQIDGTTSGISFFGPAENAEEAKQISAHFGYRVS